MNTNTLPHTFAAGLLVTLLLPRVEGRVLALRTMQQSTSSEYLVADTDGQNVYLTTATESGALSPVHDVQPVAELGEWLKRPEAAIPVAAVLDAQVGMGVSLGPLTFARAVNHLVAEPGCTAEDAIERAIAISRQCAKSEADTAASVMALMRGAPAVAQA